MTEQPQAVEVSRPPTAVLLVINTILRTLLRTTVMGNYVVAIPRHRAARNELMVVSFTGRKTGRHYSLPLTAHRIDNELYALTAAGWKRNFRDSATAEVLLNGKTTTMRGDLIEDRSVVADLYRRCAESYGVKRAQQRMGLKFRDGRMPTLEEFTEAADRSGLAAVRLISGQ